MSFLRQLFKKPAYQDKAGEEIFKEKYSAFQDLLNKNNQVLEIMADMEEKLSGEFLFDRQYIESNIKAVKDGVKDIIDNLNRISKDKYTVLYDKFSRIVSAIEKNNGQEKGDPCQQFCHTFW